MIPLMEPEIAGNEWKYIKECLDTGWVSSVGSYVDKFEDQIKEITGSPFAVAVMNGTAALHISLYTLGVGEKDEVLVPALTFIATPNAVRYCRANPVFIDVDDQTLGIDVSKVKQFLETKCEQRQDGFTYNRKTGRQIKAIIPVHAMGHPADMDPLKEICENFQIVMVEDAAESLGSYYRGRMTGTFGKVGCLSFNGNKLFTTGGGGMVLTDDEALAGEIRHLTTTAKLNGIEYDHDQIGFNYRMTNIQAAMGCAQLEKFEEYLQIKRKNAGIYRQALENIPNYSFFSEKDWAKSNFWFFTLQVLKKDKQSLLEYLLQRDIQVRPLWIPIPQLKIYEEFETFQVERAIALYDSCVNLPCSVGLKEDEIIFITDTIQQFAEARNG